MGSKEFRELCNRRNALRALCREQSLYPWRFDNLLGRLDSREGLHPSWQMTLGAWLEAQTDLLAVSVDRRFSLYNTCNCFYVVTPDGSVHGYYGFPAYACFERHVKGEPPVDIPDFLNAHSTGTEAAS